jgi:hypothetical protein
MNNHNQPATQAATPETKFTIIARPVPARDWQKTTERKLRKEIEELRKLREELASLTRSSLDPLI